MRAKRSASALWSSLTLTALFVSGCGGYRSDLALGPHMHPSTWLVGGLHGHRLVHDRNGNIRMVSTIERSCTVASSIEGRCQDTVHTHLPEQRPVQRELRWRIRYTDGNHLILRMEDDAGLLLGSAPGPTLLLQGTRRLPDGQGPKAHADVRYESLPGPGNPVLATEEYSIMGISLGSSKTLWVRVGP